MQKKLFIILISILALIIIFIAFYFISKNLLTKKMLISTTNGEVQINDIYSISQNTPAEEGDVVFKENEYYSMYYYPKDKSISIALLNQDLMTARNQAETDFLKILNVTKEDACKLLITLSVPNFVDPELSGRNYGFSFCPDGIPFKVVDGQ